MIPRQRLPRPAGPSRKWEQWRESDPKGVRRRGPPFHGARMSRRCWTLEARGAVVMDYGNNIRQAAKDEGPAPMPSASRASCRPISVRFFCRGIGPSVRAALSGNPFDDIRKTDDAVRAHACRMTSTRTAGSDMAQARIQFQGLPARTCWVGLGDRHRIGLAFNEMIARGEIGSRW